MTSTTNRIVFEGGIELVESTSKPVVTTAKIPFEITPEELQKKLGVRPILIQQISDQVPAETRTRLFPGGKQRELYEIRLSEVARVRGEARDLMELMKIQNVLGAVLYHTKELIDHYARICREFVQSRRIPNDPLADSQLVIFSYQHEPYYEFESLITAARRTYDSTRHLLWKNFGQQNDSVPRNFRITVDRCVSLPKSLSERLLHSWNTFGERITGYRDCIQHYVPIGGFMPFTTMHSRGDGIWSMTARIPDNAECNSASKFV